MKYMDKVRLKVNRKEYNDQNIFAGEVGIIWMPEIRFNEFYVMFDNHNDKVWYKYCTINVSDLELVETDKEMTDEILLQDLCKNDPRWWCKVEDGYIINLLGERKNKIPYDYDS